MIERPSKRKEKPLHVTVTGAELSQELLLFGKNTELPIPKMYRERSIAIVLAHWERQVISLPGRYY